jgi:hypothetical protein
MQALKFKKLANISDGYAYLIYPAVGCGSFTCIQYIENPDSSYGDLGKSCLRGALHSANPAFNVVGRVAANPYIRYMVQA